MPGKIYTRSKLNNLGEVLLAMYDDLKAAGMTAVLPASGPVTLTAGAGKFVMDSSATVNALHATQPWRIIAETFSSEGGTSMRIAIATNEQISDTGVVSDYAYEDQFYGGNTTPMTYQGQHTIGQLGLRFKPAPWTQSPTGSNPAQTGCVPGDVFISRDGVKNQNVSSGNTLSYLLSATPRGVTFYVWGESTDPLPVYSFFSVQIPVNKDTGVALADMNTPIFVVYDCDNTGLKKFVLSEADTSLPTRSVKADEDTANSAGIINSQEQVAVKRGNKYLVTFPNRLNTERYAYTEELDMIAYTSADVIGEGTDIPVRIYGEGSDRKYRAMKANGANNTGMRLLVLIEGGGVPNAA